MLHQLPSLETARLLLRPWTFEDVDALHCLWTDPAVRRYLWDDEVIPRTRSDETVRAAVESAIETGIGMWTVFPRSMGLLAGFCGFRGIEGGTDIELLYGFYPQYWGRGMATEAARAALRYGFDAGLLQRVYGITDAPNRASTRMLARLGMRLENSRSSGPALCYSLSKEKFAPATD